MIREASEEEVYNVLFDESILPHISDEPITPQEFPLPKDCMYLTTCGKDIFIIHPDGQVHANILPGTKDKVEKTKEAIRYVFENTKLKVLWAEIPHKYQNVFDHTVNCGFKPVYKDHINNYLRLNKSWVL